jgi:hypothetical protein
MVVFSVPDRNKEKVQRQSRKERKAKTLIAVSAMSSGGLLIGNAK